LGFSSAQDFLTYKGSTSLKDAPSLSEAIKANVDAFGKCKFGIRLTDVFPNSFDNTFLCTSTAFPITKILFLYFLYFFIKSLIVTIITLLFCLT
jgi:hypothetical protein